MICKFVEYTYFVRTIACTHSWYFSAILKLKLELELLFLIKKLALLFHILEQRKFFNLRKPENDLSSLQLVTDDQK